MKRFKTIILAIMLAVFAFPCMAQQSQGKPFDEDSLDISLLTCTPGTEIWSQFGHTAVRLHFVNRGLDIAVNYGMFSSDTPHFIPKFVLGLTDYWVDITPFNSFLAEYAYEGRGVIEQKLNISHDDKVAIVTAIYDNIRPENKVYRYNFFYDNCTTRARDIIVNNLSEPVQYPPAAKDSSTFRQMVHKWNKGYPWAQFGEDLLLGIQSDMPTTKTEQQFLPDNLRSDFDKTIYRGKPLVSSTSMIVTPRGIQSSKSLFTPMDVVMCLLIVTITLELIEYRRHKIFWGIDIFYMLITGLTGIVITAMIFSEHPTVRINLLILILNPLPLIILYPAIKRTVHKQKYWWWTVWEVLIILCMIGGFFQTYPSGMILLAFLLLTRPLMHHNREREIARKK